MCVAAVTAVPQLLCDIRIAEAHGLAKLRSCRTAKRGILKAFFLVFTFRSAAAVVVVGDARLGQWRANY